MAASWRGSSSCVRSCRRRGQDSLPPSLLTSLSSGAQEPGISRREWLVRKEKRRGAEGGGERGDSLRNEIHQEPKELPKSRLGPRAAGDGTRRAGLSCPECSLATPPPWILVQGPPPRAWLSLLPKRGKWLLPQSQDPNLIQSAPTALCSLGQRHRMGQGTNIARSFSTC